MAMVDDHTNRCLCDVMEALKIEENHDIEVLMKDRMIMETLNNTQMSLLNLACHMSHVQLVTKLLDHGVDVNTVGKDGMGPIHIVCSRINNPHVRLNILDLLIRHGAMLNLENSYGYTPLMLACNTCQLGLAEKLIDAGCAVNFVNRDGDTAYTLVCRKASERWYFWNNDALNSDETVEEDDHFPSSLICKKLLRSGVDPKQATLLPSAVLFSTRDAVKEFVDLGMDINQTDENGRSPLGCACSSSHIPPSMVQLLLEFEADPNEDFGRRKSKPIILAYVHNSPPKICLLLSYGATVSHEEMNELISLGLSKWFLENPEVIHEDSPDLFAWKLLLKAGFRPSKRGLDMKMKRVSMCSSYAKVSPWIDNLLNPILSLSDVCRVSIRNSLWKNPPIDNSVEFLPLPKRLKDFLTFSEFWRSG